MENLNWEKCKERFDDIFKQYKDLLGTPGVNTQFAINLTLMPLSNRFNSGERTQELYDEMMDVK